MYTKHMYYWIPLARFFIGFVGKLAVVCGVLGCLRSLTHSPEFLHAYGLLLWASVTRVLDDVREAMMCVFSCAWIRMLCFGSWFISSSCFSLYSSFFSPDERKSWSKSKWKMYRFALYFLHWILFWNFHKGCTSLKKMSGFGQDLHGKKGLYVYHTILKIYFAECVFMYYFCGASGLYSAFFIHNKIVSLPVCLTWVSKVSHTKRNKNCCKIHILCAYMYLMISK